jgi:hypothetical protein
MARQRQELDLADRGLRAAWNRDDSRELRDGGQQVRYRQRQRLRVAAGFLEALLKLQQLVALGRRELNQ